MKYSLSAKNLVCRNLENRAAYCADLLNPKQSKEITGLLRTDSGLLSVHFNQVVSNTVAQPRILQRFVVDYFAERHSPFSLWHCASKPLDDDALIALGMEKLPPRIAMAAEVKQLASQPKAVDGLDIISVDNADDLMRYGELVAALSDDTRESAQITKFFRQLSELPEHKYSRLKFFLGMLKDKPVATGSLFSSADALGFYDLGTLPEYRGRGIGTAMFHHLLNEVIHSHHKHAVALVDENRQNLLLNAGFYAVGEVARFQFVPQRSGAHQSQTPDSNSQQSDDQKRA
ncbi:GNAT family N-acetyltransferase [Microbulbifer sp.]|uniref:GNAT family N-acetyltransferase n=1 Tax=Microbulbifer sp. TaxID=1908541 RepID=UPI00258CA4C5|nr:GNAT family N-acetyltransferase [Microbulbifer sp.]